MKSEFNKGYYKPDKTLKTRLSALERQLLKTKDGVEAILAILENSIENPEYSSDVHQLMESISSSINSVYLAINIVNCGIYRKLWENDNCYQSD